MTEVTYAHNYTQYQLNRSWFRKIIRNFYLNNTLRYVTGKAIDFGCGTGELLMRLPEGSIGLEINKVTVQYCNNIGLNVKLYNPEDDNYEFKDFIKDCYSTFIINHVLEHLDNPDKILYLILKACSYLTISRVIVVVPGLKGFKFDKTHKTFINSLYLDEHNLYEIAGYKIIKKVYFPINFSFIENYFTYHELIFIYEKQI